MPAQSKNITGSATVSATTVAVSIANTAEEPRNTRRRQASPVQRLISGSIAGFIGTSITSPLEVMKTRLQVARTSRTISEPSIWGHAKQIYRTQGGFRPFFKGLSPSLIGILPYRAIFFCSYYQFKDLCGKETCLKNLSAGICASLMANLTTSPIWMLKALSQLDTQRKSYVDLCKDILRQRGARGFYCGFYATCAGAVGDGIHLLAYELLGRYLARNNQQPTVIQCMIASGVTKLLITSIFYPVEVVRVQLQKDSTKSYKDILLKARKQKFTRLYSGLSLQLPKIVLCTAIMFGTFEVLTRYMHSFSSMAPLN